MKILFLSENYFPNVSGVPIVVRYIAEGLAKLNHEVSIATSNFMDCPAHETINGVDVYRFNLIKDHFNRYHGDIHNYIQFVTRFECDVVVMECVMCATTDLILPILSLVKAKKVLHSHGISGLRLKPFERKSDFVHTIANTYHWLFYSQYFKCKFPKYVKQLDAVICLSEMDDTIVYCNRYGKNVQILGNAVEDVFLGPTETVTQEDIATINRPYFLSVAYYNQIKNQIDILKEFYKSGLKDYAMVFIGPSENKYYYKLVGLKERLDRKYGSRKVLFLTHVDRSHIPNIIGNAQLYLVGSTIEQFSIAILEAMAKGVPFISTNVGNASILPGGLTINNINEMHTAMLELSANIQLASKYSIAGKEYVEQFCVRDKVIRRMELIINQLL